jgi:hypothetical protein
LEVAGRFLDVDRAGVVTIDDERETMELLFEWRSERVPDDFVSDASIPLSWQPRWAEQVRRLEPVWNDDTQLLGPEHAAERALQERRGIRASAEIPMTMAGRFNGLLFFDHPGARPARRCACSPTSCRARSSATGPTWRCARASSASGSSPTTPRT